MTSHLFLLLIFLSGVARADTFKVVIDPGHGGSDRGTVQHTIEEADITLSVSKYLVDLLKKDRRFKATITRTQDEAISLNQRAQISTNADLLLSIHVNSSPEKRARGAEFYFQNELAPDEEAMYLAHQESLETPTSAVAPYKLVEESDASPEVKTILSDLLDSQRIQRSSQLAKKLKTEWKGYRKSKTNSIRQAPFFVLSQARVPATLVELGFLTNPDDFRDLTSPTSQKRMAQNIYTALIAYKDSIDKE